MCLGEYLGAVVVMSAILGLISYVSYPGSSEKTVKFAASVLLLYTALTPLLSFAGKITSGDLDNLLADFDVESPQIDDEYIKVAESAFKDGIFELLNSRFSVAEENAEIFVFGFDFRSMKADKIKIILLGDGVVADFRGIESYITGAGLGECEVNVRIG